MALIVGTALLLQLPPGAAGTEAFFKARYLALLMGATAGFLVYNCHPATIFMGDSGSLLLGVELRCADARSRSRRRGNLRSAVDRRRSGARAADSDLRHRAGHRITRAVGAVAGRRRTRSLVASSRGASGLSERSAVILLWILAGIGGGIGVAVDYFNLRWAGVVASLFLIAMLHLRDLSVACSRLRSVGVGEPGSRHRDASCRRLHVQEPRD